MKGGSWMRRFALMAVMLLMALCFQSSPAWSLDRFVDLNDGTVLDTDYGLRWLQNANCAGPKSYPDCYTPLDLCGLSDGSVSSDWILPTANQLITLVVAPDNYLYNNLNTLGFQNVQPNFYWSSSWLYDPSTPGNHYLAVNMAIGWNGGVESLPSDFGMTSYFLPVRKSADYWVSGSLIITVSHAFGIFGVLPVGSVSANHQLRLKNSGTAALPVTGITLTGTDADEFNLATGGASPCVSLTPTLSAGASCTVTVVAKPASVGYKEALLTVNTAAGSTDFPLTATATPLYVTYNGNGNSAGSTPVDGVQYLPGQTATVKYISDVLAKTGYLFAGWSTTADGSGITYLPGTTFTITANTTLYAKWYIPIEPPSNWWRGEGNGIDSVGGLTGSLMDLDFIAGKVGQAFSLNGIDASMTVPGNAKLNFGTNEFSMAAWIKTTDTREWQRLVTKRDPTGYNYWYSLVLNSGKLTFEIAGGANITSTVSVANGMWHHIAVTRDPATVSLRKYRLYIDGVENVTLADGGLNLDNTAPLEIGKWSTESYGGIYSGLIDEIQLFNRGLTAAEVQSIYNAGSAGLALVPTVSAISPSSGPATGGSQVVITGTNLASATAVKFGNNAATGFTVNSDTQITAGTPFSSGGTVDVTVTTSGGTTSGGTSAISIADQFIYTMVDQTITFGAAPTIAVGGNGNVSATAGSGLAVTFSSQTPAICSISNTTVTGVTQGGCIIKASQAGNVAYNPVEQTQSFTIAAAVAPTITTAAATTITHTGATLNATVNANYSSTLVSFEYGATTAYGTTIAASPNSVSGGATTSITAAISGLAPGSTYHFRVKAVNAVTGTVYGNDATFTATLPRFVDLNDGTVVDTVSSLRWLKNANCYGEQNWDTAMSSAANLASSSCGLTDGSIAGDWHLPIIDELCIFTDAGYRYDTLIAAGFTNIQAGGYWSSSSYPGYTDYVLGVGMVDGLVGISTKEFNYYVWPVRGGQYWSLGSLVVWGTVDFASQSIGSVSSGHQFTLKNVGAVVQPVSGIALSGTDANQFSVGTGGSAPCASLTPTLAAGASCTVMVSAAPTSSGAKTANLTVTTAIASTAIPLTVTAIYPVPAISAVSPSSGFASGGTIVTITGTALNNANAVTFADTAAASFSAGSDTQITATSPAGVIGQLVDITVTTPGGTSATSSADQFNYTLQYQAKNQSTTTPYATLAKAITAALDGAEIRVYDSQLDGAFNLDKGLALKGGYKAAFDVKSGNPTTLNGGLTVTNGASSAETLVVKGQLILQGGSLRVNEVTVRP